MPVRKKWFKMDLSTILMFLLFLIIIGIIFALFAFKITGKTVKEDEKYPNWNNCLYLLCFLKGKKFLF